MSDIFDEVDEALKEDVFKAYWVKYKVLIFSVVTAVVVGSASYSIYNNIQTERAEKWTAVLIDQVSETGALENVQDAPENYRILAELIAFNKKAEGAPQLSEVVKSVDADSALKAPLLIRELYEDFENKTPDELINALTPYNTDTSPYRHSARELLALSAYKQKNWTEVQALSEKAAADKDAPGGVNQRMQALNAIAQSELANEPEQQSATKP